MRFEDGLICSTCLSNSAYKFQDLSPEFAYSNVSVARLESPVLWFLAPWASAQGFPFLLRLRQGSTITTISNNSTVTLASPGVGKGATAALTITNQSTNPVTISNQPTLAQTSQDRRQCGSNIAAHLESGRDHHRESAIHPKRHLHRDRRVCTQLYSGSRC